MYPTPLARLSLSLVLTSSALLLLTPRSSHG